MQILNHTNHNITELFSTGIYIIYHESVENKVYVGSAARATSIRKHDIGFLVRWKKHLTELKNNKHANTHLQRVVQKYGIDNLRFKIIEKCLPSDCIERENYWIEQLDSFYNGYNLRLKGNSQLGVPHTKETIEKMRKAQKNRKLSDYTRKLISESKKGKCLSKVQIDKISNSCTTKRKIFCYDNYGKLFKIFDSGLECTRFFFSENYRKGKLWTYLKYNSYIDKKYLVFQKEMTELEVMNIITYKKVKRQLHLEKVNSARLRKYRAKHEE